MVVIGPLPALGEFIRELRSEAQLVDLMGHRVAFVRG